MFLGEFSCLAVFYLLLCSDRRRAEPTMAPPQPFNPLLFLPPALCDMTGTSLMYVGECIFFSVWANLAPGVMLGLQTRVCKVFFLSNPLLLVSCSVQKANCKTRFVK